MAAARLPAGIARSGVAHLVEKKSWWFFACRLRVLERAGLIRRTRRGREHHIRVDPRPIEEARGWIATYSRFWKQQFDTVDAYLKARSRDLGARKRDKKRART